LTVLARPAAIDSADETEVREGRRVRRRNLIILLGAAALFRVSSGRAQDPGRIYRLGIMFAGPGGRAEPFMAAFLDELRHSGFVEGQDLEIDLRASVRDEQAAEVAMALVASGVDAIFTAGNRLTRDAQQATRTVPIQTVADDLVLSGLIRSLAHPGGNTTGISILATELDGKRQQLLMELVPAHQLAALADPDVIASEQLAGLEDAGRKAGIKLSIFRASKAEEIVPAIDAAHASGAQALNVLASPLVYANQQLIRERTAALRLPAIYQWPEIAEAGGFAA
jgi:putative ABC transport system substrate-binding protein